jgi:protein-tyrosine-phosphatase
MKVLFICKNNQFRSQMAAAIYNQLTGTSDAFSAGTYVGAEDAPEGALIKNFFRKDDFFQVMEEKNLQLRNNTMKKVSPELLSEADLAVSMAEEPFIPDFLKNSKGVIWWKVNNPTFVDRATAEQTYKEIYKLTEDLIASLA